MKKTLTLVLFLGLTTTLSAQILYRTQGIVIGDGYHTKKFVINLDTMLQVRFISICLNCRWDKEYGNIIPYSLVLFGNDDY